MIAMASQIAQDVRYTARQLRRSPFFSLTVLLTLALAIGATAAMTGVLRATLLNPLPYPHPDQLVVIGDHNLKGFKDSGLLGVPRIHDLEDKNGEDVQAGRKVFADLGFYYFDATPLAPAGDAPGGHAPAQVAAVGASGNFFKTVGAEPILGRTITPADDLLRGPKTVVLSYRLWKTQFAADPGVLGRVVRLGTEQATVIGVMGPRFDLPAGTDLWRPAQMPRENFGPYRGDGTRFVYGVGRLAPGRTLADAQQQGDLLAGQLAKTYPQTDDVWAFSYTPLRTTLFGQYREALLLLATAVGLVLLAATVNLAGLQLSRNVGRAPEFAIRGALGVSRARLLRQLLTEHLLLVLSGAALGVLLGAALLRALVTRLPAGIVRVDKPHLDPVVLAVSLGISLLVGLATGVLPALGATRSRLTGAGRTTLGRTRGFGRGFTGLQVALALVLLTLSAAVLERLYTLLNAPLGFQPQQLVTFSVDLPWGMNGLKQHQFYEGVEQSFNALPGVSAAGAATVMPLQLFSERAHYDIAGQPATPLHDAVVGEDRQFSAGYLRALRIPLVAGRAFSAADADPAAPRTLMINQAMAARYFPGRNPVGERLVSAVEHVRPGDATLETYEIVGVIGDVAGSNGTLGTPARPEIYRPEDGGWPHMQFAVRSALPVSQLEPEVLRIVRAADSRGSISHITPLETTIDKSLQQPRLNAGLLTAFAALSLLLVVIGVYGLVAFDVAERTREFGLRLALGSTRGGVLSLLLRESTRILAAGLVLGLLGSYAAFRLFRATVMASAAATDALPRQLVLLSLLAALVLASAVLLATLIPAQRAARLDPTEALRTL